MKKQDLTEGAIQAKLQADHESRAAEYKAKKDAGVYAFKSTAQDQINGIFTRMKLQELENIELAFIAGYNKACYNHDVQPLEIESIPAADEYMSENYLNKAECT